jgi:hypothetical protein
MSQRKSTIDPTTRHSVRILRGHSDRSLSRHGLKKRRASLTGFVGSYSKNPRVFDEANAAAMKIQHAWIKVSAAISP